MINRLKTFSNTLVLNEQIFVFLNEIFTLKSKLFNHVSFILLHLLLIRIAIPIL